MKGCKVKGGRLKRPNTDRGPDSRRNASMKPVSTAGAEAIGIGWKRPRWASWTTDAGVLRPNARLHLFESVLSVKSVGKAYGELTTDYREQLLPATGICHHEGHEGHEEEKKEKKKYCCVDVQLPEVNNEVSGWQVLPSRLWLP